MPNPSTPSPCARKGGIKLVCMGESPESGGDPRLRRGGDPRTERGWACKLAHIFTGGLAGWLAFKFLESPRLGVGGVAMQLPDIDRSQPRKGAGCEVNYRWKR